MNPRDSRNFNKTSNVHTNSNGNALLAVSSVNQAAQSQAARGVSHNELPKADNGPNNHRQDLLYSTSLTSKRVQSEPGRQEVVKNKKDLHYRNRTAASNTNVDRQTQLEDITSEFLLQLEENKIFSLKRKKEKFPKAKFFCRLCDYHLDSKEDCIKHLKDNKHCHRKEIGEVDDILKGLAKPTEDQLVAITRAVESVYDKYGINEQDQEDRANVVKRLEKILQEQISDVSCFIYGSSLTGFGLKTSDINVNLTSADKNKKLTLLLTEVHNFLTNRTDCEFTNVTPDFAATIPVVLMTDNITGLNIKVAIHCNLAHCSSKLLSIYSAFDIRVRTLAVAFRYWAHLCWLDQKHEGFIPPQALNLMVIYFLQTINPQVVPIIQPPKVSTDDRGDFRKDGPKFDKMKAKVMKVDLASPIKMSLGELWLRLLKFYCLEYENSNSVVSVRNNDCASRHAKFWNCKKLAVEDPYILKNITRKVSNSQVYDYWQDSMRRALYYFGLPRDLQGKTQASVYGLKKILRDSNKRILAGINKQEAVKKIGVNGVKEKGFVDKQNDSDNIEYKIVDSKDSIKDKTADSKDCIKDKTTDFKDCKLTVTIAPNPLLVSKKYQPHNSCIQQVDELDDHFNCETQVQNSENSSQIVSAECGSQILCSDTGSQVLIGESEPQTVCRDSVLHVLDDQSECQVLKEMSRPQIPDNESELHDLGDEFRPQPLSDEIVLNTTNQDRKSCPKSTSLCLIDDFNIADHPSNITFTNNESRDTETTVKLTRPTIPAYVNSLSQPCHLNSVTLETVNNHTLEHTSLASFNDSTDVLEIPTGTDVSMQNELDIQKFAQNYVHSIVLGAVNYLKGQHFYSGECEESEKSLFMSDNNSFQCHKQSEAVSQSAEASTCNELLSSKECLPQENSGSPVNVLDCMNDAKHISLPAEVSTHPVEHTEMADLSGQNSTSISSLPLNKLISVDRSVTCGKETVCTTQQVPHEPEKVTESQVQGTENYVEFSDCYKQLTKNQPISENHKHPSENTKCLSDNHKQLSDSTNQLSNNHKISGNHKVPQILEVTEGQDKSSGNKKVSENQRKVSPTEKSLKKEENSSSLSESDCFYEFNKENLTYGKGPVLVCSYCEKEGHLKYTCPEEELPEVLTLPKLTPRHIDILSETLTKVPVEVGLTDESFKERELFMKSLEEFIQVRFKDAKLTLFGSSCNGFGFDKSDMDICLTFNHKVIFDKGYLIETLAKRLKQHVELTNVQAIPTAKVPIVKFTVKKTNLDGDISLYNCLALQNTKLLYCYSQIDPRVSILGYTIKTFAKICDIGDASRGSLSSYAYILMMLYYLQQVKPPVIPVLQELYEEKEKPKLIIEDWDAWFMDDLSQLNKLWPERGKNESSVAELWLGFLCFYIEEFKYKEHVVSIRQKKLLTRFEKLWNGPSLAVEDPFDLNHNLGSGLTKKMHNFILKTFINGRMLYGSPVDDNLEMFHKYQSASDYFFDTDLLSESRPPNVRGCRRCGKVGHLLRHCPTAHKDKEDELKRSQQQQQQQKQTLAKASREEQYRRPNEKSTNTNRNVFSSPKQGLYVDLNIEAPKCVEPPDSLLLTMTKLVLANSLNNPQTITSNLKLQKVVPSLLRNTSPSFVQMNNQYRPMAASAPMWLPPSLMPGHSRFNSSPTRSSQFNYAPRTPPPGFKYYQTEYQHNSPLYGSKQLLQYSGYGMSPRFPNMYAGLGRGQFPDAGSKSQYKQK